MRPLRLALLVAAFALAVLALAHFRSAQFQVEASGSGPVPAATPFALSGTTQTASTQSTPLSGTSVSVRQFGAKGDDATDDAAAINAAAAAAGPGGVVFFPAGIYRFASALTISQVSLSGVGVASVLKPTAAVASPALSFNNPYTGDTYAPMVIYNLMIDGALTRDITGVKLGTIPLSAGITLRDAVITHFAGASGRGLHIANTVNTTVSGSRIERNGSNVWIEGGNSDLPTVTSFRDSYVTLASAGAGVTIKNGYMTSFYNTVFESNYTYGLLQQPGKTQNALNTIIYGSWFENNWHLNRAATSSKFQLEVDGATGDTTSQIAVRDTFFSGNNTTGRAMWLNRVANSIISGGVIASGSFGQQTGVIVVNNGASGIEFQGYSDGDLDNWISNPDGIAFRGAYRLRHETGDAWVSWNPKITTNGGATVSATRIVTARFKRVSSGGSKTIFVELNFTTTLSAADSGFIVSMPPGLFHRDLTTYTPALLFSGGSVVPGGYVTSAGGIGSLTIVGGAVAAGAGAGARFTAVFEIQ